MVDTKDSASSSSEQQQQQQQQHQQLQREEQKLHKIQQEGKQKTSKNDGVKEASDKNKKAANLANEENCKGSQSLTSNNNRTNMLPNRQRVLIILIAASFLGGVVALRFGLFSSFSASVAASSSKQQDSDASWLSGMEFHDNFDGQGGGESDILPFDKIHPLLQIPCSVGLAATTDKDGAAVAPKKKPITTYLDTGAQLTVMSWQAAQEAGISSLMDRRYAGQTKGTSNSSCNVLGRIPPGGVTLHLGGVVSVPAPSIIIMETGSSKELLLGLDFLREYQAILNIRDGELRLLVGEEDAAVTFIRPRASLSLFEEEEDGDKKSPRDLALEAACRAYRRYDDASGNGECSQ